MDLIRRRATFYGYLWAPLTLALRVSDVLPAVRGLKFSVSVVVLRYRWGHCIHNVQYQQYPARGLDGSVRYSRHQPRHQDIPRALESGTTSQL